MLSVMLVKLVNKCLLRIEQITRIGYYLEFLNTCGLFFQSFILVPSLPYFPLFLNKRFWSVAVQLWQKVSLNERISVSALFFLQVSANYNILFVRTEERKSVNI